MMLSNGKVAKMPDKLTDAEIKKALECCNTEYKDYQCPHCPLLHKGCKKALIQEALDHINRQKAEKQDLEIELQAMRNAANGFKTDVKNLKAENDDLKRDTIPKLEDSLKRANKYGIDTDKENQQLKAEIERLKGCVKTEDEVREIAKRAMEPLVQQITNEQIDIAVKLAKAEVYKECIEKVKEILIGFPRPNNLLAIRESLDNLSKELVGEGR